MTKSYTRYDTKVQNVDIMTSAYSSDAQTMDIAMTLQYQIIEDHVIDIAREYGTLDVLQNRIQSIAIEKTKSVLSSCKAMDIIADRATMSPLVEQAIKEAIGEKYFVIVSTVVLTNIDFSDAFEKAVEDKMIAEQNQLKQEYENTAKINAAEADKQSAIKAQEAKAEADRIAAAAKIEIAKSEAEALLTQARAEADALNIQTIQVAKMLGLTEIVDGKEQIKPNLTIEEAQLIKSYIEYVKYMESWDGVLPDTVVGDNAGIILPAN
jgi:regulator of protease activity HflC (stomatin/prohibitin superfamily)